MSREALKQNSMMAHLVGALERGQDIGHYGRLVFAMVARHFMDENELTGLLERNPGVTPAQARALVLQVQGRDYNPPKRERILEWQRQQDFPICPTDDPDAYLLCHQTPVLKLGPEDRGSKIATQSNALSRSVLASSHGGDSPPGRVQCAPCRRPPCHESSLSPA